MVQFFGWEQMMAGAVSRPWAVWMLIGIVLAGLIVAALLSWSPAKAKGMPGIVAHRGGAAVAPENTLAAARQAIADGFDWIEIDVHESRDGEVIVFHDKDLKRLGNSDRFVWETDAADLQKIDIGSSFSAQFKGERIPTLGQLLDVCKDKIGVIIELKHFGHNQRLEERVSEIVKEHGMDDQVMSMSFDAEAVKRMKALRPDWQVGWLTDKPVADPRLIVADFLGVSHKVTTTELIERAHRRRMPVFVWTVNEPDLAAKIARWHPDMIITDNPKMVRAVLDDVSKTGP